MSGPGTGRGWCRERRVVVTGLGPVTPVGVGREAFWEAICEGRSGTRRLAQLPDGFPVASLQSRIVAPVTEDLGEGPLKEGPPDRRFSLGRQAMELALEDAGLEGLGETGAVVLGNAIGASAAIESFFVRGGRRGRWVPAGSEGELLRQLSFHSLSHELASRARCRGPVLTISTGCTAGLDAVGTAAELVRWGAADRVLTGSSEAPLTPVVFTAFDRIGALSRRNHDPGHASRPFDRERDGFVLGEGAAMLVLEERRQALARQAHIYCEIAGFASLSNAFHMTRLPAGGSALTECIQAALDDADVEPRQIDHVNAHGSSTPQNDLCETNAIKGALGRHADRVTVNSLKALIGHALGASNAIELAACALALDRQYLFPTSHLDQPGEGCDLDYVANRSRTADLGWMLKLSNGFSGIHSAMVMRRAS